MLDTLTYRLLNKNTHLKLQVNNIYEMIQNIWINVKSKIQSCREAYSETNCNGTYFLKYENGISLFSGKLAHAYVPKNIYVS